MFRAVWLQFASCFISEDISTSGSDSSEPIERERERETVIVIFFLVGTVGIGKLLAEEEKGSWFEDCKV